MIRWKVASRQNIKGSPSVSRGNWRRRPREPRRHGTPVNARWGDRELCTWPQGQAPGCAPTWTWATRCVAASAISRALVARPHATSGARLAADWTGTWNVKCASQISFLLREQHLYSIAWAISKRLFFKNFVNFEHEICTNHEKLSQLTPTWSVF